MTTKKRKAEVVLLEDLTHQELIDKVNELEQKLLDEQAKTEKALSQIPTDSQLKKEKLANAKKGEKVATIPPSRASAYHM